MNPWFRTDQRQQKSVTIAEEDNQKKSWAHFDSAYFNAKIAARSAAASAPGLSWQESLFHSPKVCHEKLLMNIFVFPVDFSENKSLHLFCETRLDFAAKRSIIYNIQFYVYDCFEKYFFVLIKPKASCQTFTFDDCFGDIYFYSFKKRRMRVLGMFGGIPPSGCARKKRDRGGEEKKLVPT